MRLALLQYYATYMLPHTRYSFLGQSYGVEGLLPLTQLFRARRMIQVFQLVFVVAYQLPYAIGY